ncbi:MAG: UDP-N-acetylmuramoyl-tripeptide--D-alanyl-D-alanine ligase [Fusobacteriota bacterium]
MYIGEKLKEYLNQKSLLEMDKTLEINSIKSNSKEVKKGDAFLAIRGGNNYLKDAINKEASLIIYDRKDAIKGLVLPEEIKLIKVKSSIKFLQEFATYYRMEINPTVIAITGSNGKTTTKDILNSILKEKSKTLKTKGNYNNHIGLPLTILNLKKDTEYLILEMGMSGLGEIDFLCKIAQPNYGIITNIGEAHLEQLKTKENIFKAKTEMLKHIDQKVVINGDDEYLEKIDGLKVGFKSKNAIVAQNIVMDHRKGISYYDLKINENKYLKIQLDLLGKHNVVDSLLAIGIAVELNLDMKSIRKGLKNIDISGMRNQIIKKGKTIYINDAYNANPTSVKSGLEFFSNVYNDKIKVIVLGDMLELGEESYNLHSNLKEEIKKYKFNHVFLYGKNMRYLYNNIKKENIKINNIKWFKTKREIKKKIFEIEEEKVIFLKGSRGMKLEKIIEE